MSLKEFKLSSLLSLLSILALGLTACGRAASGDAAGSGYAIGSGRAVPTVAALVGLVSLVIGALALARPALFSGRGPIVALTGALMSVVIGGLHWTNSAGGLGTGNGLAGAIVAVAAGLIAMLLGVLALVRSRRTESPL